MFDIFTLTFLGKPSFLLKKNSLILMKFSLFPPLNRLEFDDQVAVGTHVVYTNLLGGLNNGSFKTWVANIENMLIAAGLTKVWEDQSCGVADIHNFRSRLHYVPSIPPD